MARILHLTDIHFGGEDKAAVEAATAFAHDYAPDVVVVTGDLTLNGLPREFQAAADWLGRLPGPQVVTPGNHDTPYLNIPLRALIPFNRYRRWIGPTHGGHDHPEVALRAVNSSRGAQPRPDWSKGAVNLKNVERAAAELGAGPHGRLRVFACHHPLIEQIGVPVTGDTHRGHLAAEILHTHGVDLILTGHVHNPFAIPLPFGDGLTYAVGAGTLSKRLRGVPASFNTMSIEPGCVEVRAMAWTGSHYEPFRDWALPRRERAL